MANPRKPASQRTGHANTTRDFGLVKGGRSDPPPCPAKFGDLTPLPSTRAAWKKLWDSDIAAVIDLKSDIETVKQWAGLIDERERAFQVFRKKRLVEGSQGQPVLNPLWQVVTACDARLQGLSDRLGLSPKARLQLGIEFGQAAKSLDELNRLMMEGDANGDDDTDEAPASDPRVGRVGRVIDTSSS